MKPLTANMDLQARHRFVEVIERIVRLYDETGQTDNAEKWRKELEAAKQLEKDAKK